jgi:hypothetical protein
MEHLSPSSLEAFKTLEFSEHVTYRSPRSNYFCADQIKIEDFADHGLVSWKTLRAHDSRPSEQMGLAAYRPNPNRQIVRGF